MPYSRFRPYSRWIGLPGWLTGNHTWCTAWCCKLLKHSRTGPGRYRFVSPGKETLRHALPHGSGCFENHIFPYAPPVRRPRNKENSNERYCTGCKYRSPWQSSCSHRARRTPPGWKPVAVHLTGSRNKGNRRRPGWRNWFRRTR